MNQAVVDRLPDFSTVVSADDIERLAGADAEYTVTPEASDEAAQWDFRGSAGSLRLTVDLVRSVARSDVEMAKRFFQDKLDLWSDAIPTELTGADEAVRRDRFGIAFAARVRNVLVELSLLAPEVDDTDRQRVRDATQRMVDLVRE